MAKKQKGRLEERTVRIRLKPRRLDIILGKIGGRIGRLKGLEKLREMRKRFRRGEVKTQSQTATTNAAMAATAAGAGRASSREIGADKLALIRSVLTEEKMRILRTIKERQPSSIYELAKFLGRDLKTVREDLKRLTDASFIRLETLKEKNRKRVKPVLEVKRLNIVIDFA